MLLDKSGLREKGNTVTSNGNRKPRTEEEKKKLIQSLFNAVRESESPDEKAERIRNELKSKRDGR